MTRVISKPVARIDGDEKVSGKARFTADVASAGMLWGLTLRSPLPHAKILHIDVSRATSLVGVKAVLTGLDLPDMRIGRQIRDLPILAREKVRFVGEKVAAVAAEEKDVAEEALSLIEVDYDELPAVFDPLSAMEDSAPIIHENPSAYEGAPQLTQKINNVVSLTTKAKGDAEIGLTESDRVFEHTFKTPFVHQAYMEPHACACAIDAAGKIHIWASNKSPFLLRAQVAAALGVSADDVIVHLMPVGGDFGGKGSPMDAPLCYHLAKASGHAVKMVMSYTEELMAGNPRHASVITLRTGVKKNGDLQAMQIKCLFDSGAYAAFKPIPDVNLAAARTAGGIAYRMPAIQIDSYCIYTNNVPCGHMRGPGYPQIAFAIESQMDIVARALGIDPIEFRMRNLVNEGDEPPLGGRWEGIKAKETLSRAAEASGWKTLKKRPYVGRGVAVIQKSPGMSATGANIVIDSSGHVTLRMGVPEQGSGSHTILRQIIAEELGILLELVSIETGATDAIPDSGWGSGASSVSHSMGQAAVKAAKEVRAQLLAEAAELFGVEERLVSLENGDFLIRGVAEQKRIPFQKLVSRLVAARGRSYDVTVVYDMSAGMKGEFSFSGVTSFCAQVAEVEVDAETGRIAVTKITTAHDVGTILNPMTHQGQIEGGLIQGIGFAVMEDLCAETGRALTLNLGDYRIPTARDIPRLKTHLVQNPSGPVPYHGKAIGEISIVPVAAAIGNAIYDATGVRLFTLPFTAEKVYWGLKGRLQPG
ncbi:MAG: xanthine dehydrogenase family protein molybdopterin-binding subunit [Deltaproteobacteria bacterium]|nr:xanthine dehydrogenase family protein molybdopterin-binding subunit [Deltaproteobacteria bacterium]